MSVVPKSVLPNKNVLYIFSTCKTIHLADKIINGTFKMSYPDIFVQNCIVFLAHKLVIILYLKLSGKAHLRKHIEVMHERIHNTCDNCDYAPTNKSVLRRHKQSTHEGICNSSQQCDYNAVHKFHLHSHIRKFIEKKHI